MDIYEVTEDTRAIIDVVSRLNENVVSAVFVTAALVGLLLGYLVFTELLRIWLS